MKIPRAFAYLQSCSGVLCQIANSPEASCGGEFKSLTASEFLSAANPGWNLGNTLDAVPDEGSWNNPPVAATTFDDVKEAGFKGVRLPVTWADHYTGSAPDWTIDTAWMDRVSEVVDAITSRGLYAIVNMHHDSWQWVDVSAYGANISMIEEKFRASWSQIGAALGCKSSMVAFEPINEPPGSTEAHADEINRLNVIFLDAINAAGGWNSQRVVTLMGMNSDSTYTSQYFEMPKNYSNPMALQHHVYAPYDFVFSAWGKTIWGSDADKQAIDDQVGSLSRNFSGIPITIGEYSASPATTEPAARWKYHDFLIRTAAKYNQSLFLWDNGLDYRWFDPTVLQITMEASVENSNSLPDSTEDASANSQFTSAFIFHRVGTPVEDQSLPWLFNGNTLTSVSDGETALTEGTDYSTTDSAITFTASALSQWVSETSSPGSKANLTLTFTSGAEIMVNVVQYASPTLSSSSSTATNANSDLAIPISWNGVNQPATIRAVRSDNVILVDDWTQYLGPLQRGRLTYSSNYNWDHDHVILTSATLQAVLDAGVATTFTIETYPRVPGNWVNYTLNV